MTEKRKPHYALADIKAAFVAKEPATTPAPSPADSPAQNGPEIEVVV